MRYGIIACVGMVALACSRNVEVVSTPGGSAAVVTSREWTLVTLRSEPVPSGSRAVTLRFNAADGRASGFGPCNQYSGPYSMSGESLRFGAIVSTKMACVDNDRNRLEQAFFAALAEVTAYEVSDSTLTLTAAAGNLAVFHSH